MFGIDLVLGSITIVIVTAVSRGVALSSVLLLSFNVGLFVMMSSHSACSPASHLTSSSSLIIPAGWLLLGDIVSLSLFSWIPVFAVFPSITLLLIPALISSGPVVSGVSLGLVVVSSIIVSFLPFLLIVSAVGALVGSFVGASFCFVFSTVSLFVTGLVSFSPLVAPLLDFSIYICLFPAICSLWFSFPVIISPPSSLSILSISIASVAISALGVVLPFPFLFPANQAA